MHFDKMQGAGNDFILLDARDQEREWEKLAVAMCDRHFGVGADGLILALASSEADTRMRIFNADGSEAEMCGNGMRCFARYVIERGLASPRDGLLRVETKAGVLLVRALLDDGNVSGAEVNMGQPRLRAEDVPVDAAQVQAPGTVDGALRCAIVFGEFRLDVTCLSMGNPHAVAFSPDSLHDLPLGILGPLVENHKAFPQRVNFEVARPLDRRTIEARLWERGVGETLACGTGACAVAVAARLHGYVDDELDVKLPGGTLHVTWDGQGEVMLSGPAAWVFSGEWPEDAAEAPSA